MSYCTQLVDTWYLCTALDKEHSRYMWRANVCYVLGQLMLVLALLGMDLSLLTHLPLVLGWYGLYEPRSPLSTKRPINSLSPPSATYMHQWIGSALVQIMACRLFGAKSLSKPMLAYCQLDLWEQISVKFKSEFYYIHSQKCIWNCRLPKWQPFCPRGDESTTTLISHEQHNVWYHWQLDWLFNSLLRLTTCKTSTFNISGLCEGNHQ